MPVSEQILRRLTRAMPMKDSMSVNLFLQKAREGRGGEKICIIYILLYNVKRIQ